MRVFVGPLPTGLADYPPTSPLLLRLSPFYVDLPMTKSQFVERGSRPFLSKTADVIFSSKDQIVCDSGHIQVRPMTKGDMVDKDSTVPKVYWCDFATCCHKSKSSNNMRTHRRMHKRENPHVCMEIDCEARFNSEKLLRRHRNETGHESASEVIMATKLEVLSKVNIVNGDRFFRSKTGKHQKKTGVERNNQSTSLSDQGDVHTHQKRTKAPVNLQGKNVENGSPAVLLSEPIRPVISGSTPTAFILCLALFSTVSNEWILGYFNACPIPDTMLYQFSPLPRALFHCSREDQKTSMLILESNVTLFPAFTIAHNQQAIRPITNKRFMSFIAQRCKDPNVFTFHEHDPVLMDLDLDNIAVSIGDQATIKEEADEVSVRLSSSAPNSSKSQNNSAISLNPVPILRPIMQAPSNNESSRAQPSMAVYTVTQGSVIKQDEHELIKDRGSGMRSSVNTIPPNITKDDCAIDRSSKSLLAVTPRKSTSFRHPSNPSLGNAAAYSTLEPESPDIPLRQLARPTSRATDTIPQTTQQAQDTTSSHCPRLLWKLKSFFQSLVLPPVNSSLESQSQEQEPTQLSNADSFDRTARSDLPSAEKSVITVTILGASVAGDQFRILTLPGSILD